VERLICAQQQQQKQQQDRNYIMSAAARSRCHQNPEAVDPLASAQNKPAVPRL
jgi:hypothetical protein